MQHGEPMPEEVQAKSEEPDEEQRLFVITEKHRHLDRRCPCSAVQGLCVIEGLPNNRPGFGRVLNHDGSSFPMAGATATASGKYLLSDGAAGSRRFLVGV